MGCNFFVIFLSSNSQAINFYSDKIYDIRIDKNSNDSSLAISSLFEEQEDLFNKEIQSLINNIKNKGPIIVTEKFSKFSVLLKYMLPNICKDTASNDEMVYNEIFDNLYNSLSKNSRAESFLSDMDNIYNKSEIEANKQTLIIMLFLKIACLNINKSLEKKDSINSSNASDLLKNNNESGGLGSDDRSDESKIVDPFLGTDMQPGTVIINNGFNGTNEFDNKLLEQFGINNNDWKVGKKKDIKSLEEKGFIEVNKEKIPDIESYYEKHKDELGTLEEVEGKLSFYPERIENKEYKLLGVSPSGTIDDEGLSSSLVRVYESPLGKIIINEENLESSNAIVSLDKDFLNIKIGKSPASLVAKKSEDSDNFVTEIYWINNTKNRAYTVEINSNLNSDGGVKKRENLLNFLNNNFEIVK